MEKLKNVHIKPGDKISLDHSVIDRREVLHLIVAHSSVKHGRGVSVFVSGDGNTYLWRPCEKDPHGMVHLVRTDGDSLRNLFNPYVKVLREKDDKYVPVYSKEGTYLIKE